MLKTAMHIWECDHYHVGIIPLIIFKMEVSLSFLAWKMNENNNNYWMKIIIISISQGLFVYVKLKSAKVFVTLEKCEFFKK